MMEKNQVWCCENCERTNESIEIQRVTVNQHTAMLCQACAHILTLPKNNNRFFQLVRKKNMDDSNKEMQKVHQLLSAFIAVGALFLVVIVAAGIAQNYDFTTIAFQEIQSTAIDRPLSFLQLKSFN